MPVVRCEKCTRSFNAPDSAIGKVAKCPKCGEPIKIEDKIVLTEVPAAGPQQGSEGSKTLEVSPPNSSVHSYESAEFLSPARPLYLFSVAFAAVAVAGLISGLGLEALSGVIAISSYIPAIGGVVTGAMLVYRMWNQIPEKERTTTPAKAVGLSFVPIFNFYWLFRSVYGLSLITKSSRSGEDNTPKLATWAALGFCVLFIAPVAAFLVRIDYPNDLDVEVFALLAAFALGGTWLFLQAKALRTYLGKNQSDQTHVSLITFLITLLLATVVVEVSAVTERASARVAKAREMVETCSAFSAAQNVYARRDHDRDGLLEYAASMRLLYESRPGAADLQLLSHQFVMAEGRPSEVPNPQRGYRYRVLTGQGDHALGGAFSYVDANGNMTQGFGFIAYPSHYVLSGRESFLVNHQGTIYKADLGRRTNDIVEKLTMFDPDPKVWQSFTLVIPIDQLSP